MCLGIYNGPHGNWYMATNPCFSSSKIFSIVAGTCTIPYSPAFVLCKMWLWNLEEESSSTKSQLSPVKKQRHIALGLFF